MKKKSHNLFIFIDSYGHELIKEYGSIHPEVSVSRPVKMQFGYSATAIPSILTGKKPSEHGQFTFFYRSKSGDSMFKFFDTFWFKIIPKFISNRRRFRVLLNKIFKNYFKIRGYFDLYAVPFNRLKYFDYSEKRDLFDLNAFDNVVNIKDILVRENIPHFISNWRNSEDQNFSELNETICDGDVEFIFAYFAGLDGTQHMHTKDGVETKTKLDYYEKHISHTLNNAKEHYENVEFGIFSDHGMTSLIKEVDINPILLNTGLKFGVDYLSFIDSTMLRVWYLKPESEKIIKDSILIADIPGRFLSVDEMKEWGVYFEDGKYGDDIFLVEPGVQLNPSDMGGKALPGMHRYDPSDKDSNAVWMANYKAQKEPTEVREIFDCMLEKVNLLKMKS